jgi:Gpi18-like mannosyltransferase
MDELSVQQPLETQQFPPNNYLVWAILTTIFCCLPFGIVSIVYAAQVNSKWMMGDYDGARASSKNAKLWAWISFGIAIALSLIWVALIVFGVIAGIGAGIFEGLSV